MLFRRRLRPLLLAGLVALGRMFSACSPTVGPGDSCSSGLLTDPQCPAGYVCVDIGETCKRLCACSPSGEPVDDPGCVDECSHDAEYANYVPPPPPSDAAPTADDVDAMDASPDDGGPK
jgi:hypothetical protein